MAIALGELAVRFGCELRGDPDLTVDHVAPLSDSGPGALSFLANAKLAAQLPATRAAAVVLDPKTAAACPAAVLITTNPHALFARIATLLYPPPPLRPGTHPSAIVEPGAAIDSSAEVAALAVIGAGAEIGARCLIGPGCIVGSGVRIGSDSRLVARVTLAPGVGRRPTRARASRGCHRRRRFPDSHARARALAQGAADRWCRDWR